MPSTSETGHAKIPANLYTLNSIGKRYPTIYKPSNPKLVVATVDGVSTTGDTLVTAVPPLAQAYNAVISTRQTVNATINPTATAAVNSLGSVDGVNAGLLKAAKAALKKITGAASTKATTTAPTDGTPTPTLVSKHSVSQQSFDMRANNFSKLIDILKQIPQYTPTETELKITNLDSLVASLKVSNKAVDDAYIPYAMGLKSRDTYLYHPETGIVKLSKQIKSYIKSVKAISAADKKEAMGIAFSSPAKKDLFL